MNVQREIDLCIGHAVKNIYGKDEQKALLANTTNRAYVVYT